jgi:hypothetical protein
MGHPTFVAVQEAASLLSQLANASRLLPLEKLDGPARNSLRVFARDSQQTMLSSMDASWAE